MVEEKGIGSQHVGALLSGFVDGELTQQQRQFVSLHCDACSECRDHLARLRELRERVGKARLSETSEDNWRETMDDSSVRFTRGIGWLIFIIGLLAIAGIGLLAFILNDEMSFGMKLIFVGIYGGLALLLISVLRQTILAILKDTFRIDK